MLRRTYFNCCDLVIPQYLTAQRGASPSPLFEIVFIHRIELQDYSEERDYSAEPPSRRTNQSPGIRLYG